MSPFQATNQFLQLLLSGMLLTMTLPSHTMTAPSRPARSSCTQASGWTPKLRLLAGVEVLKTYENRAPSLQSISSQVPSHQSDVELFDLPCHLVILRELTKKVNLNLFNLTDQNVKDAGEWLRSVYGNDTNNATLYEGRFYEHCLQSYLENHILQFDAWNRITGLLSGCGNNQPTSEQLQIMWIYSNNEIIDCSSLYNDADCTVNEETCHICD